MLPMTIGAKDDRIGRPGRPAKPPRVYIQARVRGIDPAAGRGGSHLGAATVPADMADRVLEALCLLKAESEGRGPADGASFRCACGECAARRAAAEGRDGA